MEAHVTQQGSRRRARMKDIFSASLSSVTAGVPTLAYLNLSVLLRTVIRSEKNELVKYTYLFLTEDKGRVVYAKPQPTEKDLLLLSFRAKEDQDKLGEVILVPVATLDETERWILTRRAINQGNYASISNLESEGQQMVETFLNTSANYNPESLGLSGVFFSNWLKRAAVALGEPKITKRLLEEMLNIFKREYLPNSLRKAALNQLQKSKG